MNKPGEFIYVPGADKPRDLESELKHLRLVHTHTEQELREARSANTRLKSILSIIEDTAALHYNGGRLP